MSYQTIEVRPLSGALGAEIEGVDLSKDLDNQTFDEVHRALLENLVIFFRNQELKPDQQIAFARRFGDIHFHPYMRGLDDHPEILELIKEEGDTHTFGEVWHTDQMFNPKPAMGTMLYAKEVPPAGGDTMYANMYMAYDALSDGMKELAGKLKTFNVGDRMKSHGKESRKDRYKGSKAMHAKVKDPGDDVVTEAVHPLVRTHPEAGRKAIYLGNHTQRFEGMTDEESAPLITFLSKHSTRPEFVCRFRWQVGSLALWDNRCTQHYAIGDYDGRRRRMHRITIAGDRPF